MDHILNLIKTLGLVFFFGVMMLLVFYVSYLIIPFMILSVAGIAIFNYLKLRAY